MIIVSHYCMGECVDHFGLGGRGTHLTERFGSTKTNVRMIIVSHCMGECLDHFRRRRRRAHLAEQCGGT